MRNSPLRRSQLASKKWCERLLVGIVASKCRNCWPIARLSSCVDDRRQTNLCSSDESRFAILSAAFFVFVRATYRHSCRLTATFSVASAGAAASHLAHSRARDNSENDEPRSKCVNLASRRYAPRARNWRSRKRRRVSQASVLVGGTRERALFVLSARARVLRQARFMARPPPCVARAACAFDASAGRSGRANEATELGREKLQSRVARHVAFCERRPACATCGYNKRQTAAARRKAARTIRCARARGRRVRERACERAEATSGRSNVARLIDARRAAAQL